MYPNCTIKAPFFEIGPKSYLFGDDVVELAKAADAAAERYDVDIIFTTPLIELRRVKDATHRIHVFAPHMDPLHPGRGLADVLPESLKAAGAEGVMLNHCEKPLTIAQLKATIQRADEVGLATIVCADSIAEASAIAHLCPNIIVAEPSELIGTGKASDKEMMWAGRIVVLIISVVALLIASNPDSGSIMSLVSNAWACSARPLARSSC